MATSDQPLPKYSQLKEYLKERMRRGEIGYDEPLPSENVLARQFTISRHTVREALGDLENEGWIRRERGRGTFCIYTEKVSGKTVAVITTYISEYIFPTIIRGIEAVLSAAGYTLVLANTNNDKDKEAQCLENLLGQDIAGFIVEPTKSALENTNLSFFQELEHRKIPFIFLHAAYPNLEAASITLDDRKGGYLAANYLLQLGHRDIAGIFKADDLQGVERRAGFLQAMMEYQLEVDPDLLGAYTTRQLASYPYEFTRDILKRSPRPSALVCYNDQIALKAMGALREEGLRVPEDFSVIGYDDSSLATASEVRLSTVKHPKAEMGKKAAQLLITMIEGQIERPQFVYQPELVIRESCKGR